MPLCTTCTVCGCPLVGSPDDDACCEDCAAVNFPPPQDLLLLPWWQAARLTLAPHRDAIRAMYRTEETPDAR